MKEGSPTVTFQCPSCRNHVTAEFNRAEIKCSCGKSWGCALKDSFFERCPLCGCSQFYLQKDFNQFLGCSVVLLGIIGVPFTYGLSLPVLALADWLIYRKVQMLILSYQCAAEFRRFTPPQHFKTFKHPIGVKYDK